MKLFIFVFALFFAQLSLAARLQVRVDSIDEGLNGESHLILMSDGNVGYLNPADKESLQSLKDISGTDQVVEIELDAKHNVLSLRSVDNPPILVPPTPDDEDNSLAIAYEPTVVSQSTGQQIFSQMRRNYQNQSQCYNRAHIWTYEEFQRSATKSLKVFMFFTRRYIRNYRYHWWFHVTPVVQTPEGLRTLDRRYTRGLLSLRAWSNIFVRSHQACPIISKYYDYRNNQESEDCYHIPVSMYFWQPRDIERRDRTGYEKSQYYNSEVKHAYWEAF